MGRKRKKAAFEPSVTMARVALVLYIALVAYLCFGHIQNTYGIQYQYFGIPTDKIVHFIMFLPFPLLSYYAIGRPGENMITSLLVIASIMVAGCVLAAATEVGQSYTLYRTGDPMDFRTDVIALAVSSCFVLSLDIFRHHGR